MDLSEIKGWLIPASTCLALVTGSIAGWLSLKEFRLKVAAERRLADTARIESDIQLLQAFTKLMPIAHARGGYHVSEKAVELIIGSKAADLASSPTLLRELLDDLYIRIPVGAAEQDAAIAAIWSLGTSHPTLRPSAVQALRSIAQFKPQVAQQYFDRLEQVERDA